MTTLDLPTLRTSERSTFKRCPWRWLQEYRFGFKPRFVEADAAWFGIGIHEALAPWYGKGKRRGPHPADTFEKWCGSEMEWAKTYLDENFDAPVWESAHDLGISMLEEYVKKYGRDSQWDIISTERPFKIKITDGGRPVAYFASRWDGVFRDLGDGRIYLLETKTASQIQTAYLENDDQGGSYWAVAGTVLRAEGVLDPGEEIAGIIYNFLRKQMPDTRERNEDGLYLNLNGEVSRKQPAPYFLRVPVERSRAEQATQLQKIADEIEWMNAIRSGALKPIKITTKDCPRCPLWGPCVLHEQGSDSYKSVLKADFIQRDPYEDTRKSAAE
jgi:Zierdtviridae exonuclease